MIKKHLSAPSLVLVGTKTAVTQARSSGEGNSELSDEESVSSEPSEPPYSDSQPDLCSFSASEISPGPTRRSREQKKKRMAPPPPGRSNSMRNPIGDKPFIIVNQNSTDSESQTEYGFTISSEQCQESSNKDPLHIPPYMSKDKSKLKALKDALKSPRNIRKNSKKYSKEEKEGTKSSRLRKNATIVPPDFTVWTGSLGILTSDIDVDSEFEIKRIPDYDRYLSDLVDGTESSHPDFDDLSKAAKKVKTMVKEQEDELRESDYDHKMDSIQDRFPHDDLQLRDRDKTQKLHGLSTRRKSAPSAVLFKTLGGSKSRNSGSVWNQSTMGKRDVDMSNPLRNTADLNRVYIMEGPVQFANGMQTQDRYLFLFNDLLLIAKQKSTSTFKLKQRIQLSDVWISECIEVVSEVTRPQDRSFVIGWPTTNTVATFKDSEIKDLWKSKLKQHIQEEKLKEESRTTQVRVVNRAVNKSCQLKVNNIEDAKDVLRLCMEKKLIPESEQNDYQLWVLTGKEGTPYPLIGHEIPYSIKLSHIRDIIKPRVDEGQTLSNLQDPSMDDLPNMKCEFILKHKKSPKKHSLDEASQKSLKKAKKSPLLTLFKRNNNRDEKTAIAAAQPLGKLFDHPLDTVCLDGGLPKPILDMMYVLFHNGPYTTGILRKSANARQMRELRQKLDSGEETSMAEYTSLVIGSVLKDYLRSLPNSLLVEDLFADWTKVNEIETFSEKLDQVKHLVERLPHNNFLLLKYLMCVLHQIEKHSEENKMTSFNLSLCIAPSLLFKKTPDASCLAGNAPVVQFMIDNCSEIFGKDTPCLFGNPVEPKVRQDSGTDSDSIHSGLHGLRRDDSSVDSLVDRDLYSGEVDSSPKLAKSHLSPSNLSRDSGLTLSDSQLNDEDCEGFESVDQQSVFMRSASHCVDRDSEHMEPEMFSRSLESKFNLESSNPVPPPRSRRKKGSDFSQSSSLDSYNRTYLSSSQTSFSTSRLEKPSRFGQTVPADILRQSQFSKRVSSDSLQSVEESTEGESDRDSFRHRHQSGDMGLLIKSASGGHLYLDDETLPRRSDCQSSHPLRDRLVRQSSVTDSTPPLSPQSKYSFSSSRDSVLSDSSACFLRELSRDSAVHSAPQTPDDFLPEKMLGWGTEERERSNSNPVQMHSSNNFMRETANNKTSPSLSSSYNGVYSLKSMENMKYLVSPPHSPGVERRNKSTHEISVATVRHSYPLDTSASKGEVYLETSPKISITSYCSSGSDERLDGTEGVSQDILQSSTGNPINIHQTGMGSPPSKIVLQQLTQKSVMRKDCAPVKASYDSAIVSQVRERSLDSAPDFIESEQRLIESNLLERSKVTVLTRTGAKNYDSDTRLGVSMSNLHATCSSDLLGSTSSKEFPSFDNRRTGRPPSYHEALQRNYMIKHGIPLEISEQDTQRQKEASARAKQLYQASLQKYLQGDDECSKQQGSSLKVHTARLHQHIEQHSDSETQSSETSVEESSMVEQCVEQAKTVDVTEMTENSFPHAEEDVYVMLKKDPKQIFAESVKMYEQSKKSNLCSQDVPKSSNTSVQKGYSKLGKTERVKTTLTVPSVNVHRSLSDSADRLNKLGRTSPRMSRKNPTPSPDHSDSNVSSSQSKYFPNTGYFYQPEEEIKKSSLQSSTTVLDVKSLPSSSDHQSSTSVRSTLTVTKSNPTENSDRQNNELPWSVRKLQKLFDSDKQKENSSSSHFHSPDPESVTRSVRSITVTSTSRPGPPPYKSPPPFRRLHDNTRLSTSSNSSAGSTSTGRSSSPSFRRGNKFGPQSLDYSSFSSSSEELDTPTRYHRARSESHGSVSKSFDYTDVSYV